MNIYCENVIIKSDFVDVRQEKCFSKNMLLSLITGLILLTGCAEEKDPVTAINFDEIEFAPFVEEEFPFINTFLLVTNGETENLYPENNAVARCLALILGEDAYACFDTDMLRWAAAWNGDFVPLEGVSQKAYPDFLSRNDRMPYLHEKPHMVTGLYPGWSAGEPRFSDPRPPSLHPDEPSWGPLPADFGRWNGIYITDEGPALSYTVQNIAILETPGSFKTSDETVFTRTFRIENPDAALSLVAAEVPGAIRSEVNNGQAAIYHSHNETATVISLLGADGIVNLDVKENRYATATVSAHDEPVEFTLLMWTGDADHFEHIRNTADHASFAVPDVAAGWANPWPENVHTRGKLAPDTSAYVLDELTLPIPNPWNRNVRVVDTAFFDDGTAAVVTFDGDVWLVEGIDERLNSIKWSRFASGLFETQSIEIVDGEIYTYGKEGITRLHDLNGNGSADFYENFSNLMTQSIETREWASDMAAKPDGGFYVGKGGALDMGPHALSGEVIRGFRTGSAHSGVILEISEDGREAEVIASGLRGPYLGIHPETGLLTASDQQGHYVPSTPLLTINRGDYYGVSATAHRNPVPEEITPPLMWIPHDVDPSGISQVWITGNRMGPLNDNLIHFSYTRPGLFRVLIDSTTAGLQGGTSSISAQYPAPTMKGAMNAADGQLYITGFTLWGTNSEGMTGFTRLRYTGLPNYLPAGFSIRDGGLILRFDEKLDESSLSDLSNYQVQRWNYQRSEAYGSGHFRLDGTPGQEILPVFSAHLSDDGKGVFLAIPNIQPAEQMQLSYRVRAADGTVMDDNFWFTVNHTEEINLIAEGFNEVDTENLFTDAAARAIIDDSSEPASANRGHDLFHRTGCMACHTTDGSTGTGVGPTLKNVFGKERRFQDGTSEVADEQYLRQKLIYPGEKILEGYDEGMPSFLGILSDDEIESIVLYIKTLE